MVDAYTFTNKGESKSFGSRAEMFDWMILNGHLFLDGDHAKQMLLFAQKKLKTLTDKAQIEKYNEAITELDVHVLE